MLIVMIKKKQAKFSLPVYIIFINLSACYFVD